MINKEHITRALTTTIRNTKRLDCFSSDFLFASQAVLDEMAANDIQLKHFGFAVDDDDHPVG